MGLLHAVGEVLGVEGVALLVGFVDSAVVLLLLGEFYKVFLVNIQVAWCVFIKGARVNTVENHSPVVTVCPVRIILDVLVEESGGALLFSEGLAF